MCAAVHCARDCLSVPQVLVNMTFSSPALQRHVAEAGGLEAGRALLRATNANGKVRHSG